MEFAAMLGSLLSWAVVTAGGCCVVGFLILDRVDRGWVGVLLGFFLGPIGLVIAWVLRDNALRDQEERDRRHQRPDPAAARRGFGAHTGEQSAAAAIQQQSPIDELERLAALRERGHIT